VEQSLANLVAVERYAKGETVDGYGDAVGGMSTGKDGRKEREEVWWTTWREMGFEDGGEEIWPVPKIGRGGR